MEVVWLGRKKSLFDPTSFKLCCLLYRHANEYQGWGRVCAWKGKHFCTLFRFIFKLLLHFFMSDLFWQFLLFLASKVWEPPTRKHLSCKLNKRCPTHGRVYFNINNGVYFFCQSIILLFNTILMLQSLVRSTYQC